jgi:allantoinase
VTADLVVRGGLVPRAGSSAPADVVVVDGVIAAVTTAGAGGRSRRTIDATGLVVLAGAVDAHVHFDEPGRTEWEGWATGSLAAAAGGVTTVVDMPIDSHPPTIDAGSVRAKAESARASSLVDFALWGGLVPGNVDILDPLLSSGVVGLKAFMCDSGWAEFPACPPDVLARGMRAAARADVPVAVHCEDPSLLGPGDRDRPLAAEVAAVARAGATAAAQGARLHVVHCSSADAVIEAKLWPRATVETCPHYLTLTGGDEAQLGPDAVCSPPLRDEDARLRLWQAVHSGLVDTIASDHSPGPPAHQEGRAPFPGISGVQTTLSLLLTSAELSLRELSRLRTSAARLLGLHRKGVLAPGYDADLVLVDLDSTWVVGGDTLRTRQARSPFMGRTLRGVVVSTLVRGNVVFESGRPMSDPQGAFLRPAATAPAAAAMEAAP